jgi:hypothetical protein
MLIAYIDDSGTHEKSHNCVIGGYWGGVKEWSHFEAQWNRVLRSEGIEEFKANEFWPRPAGKRIGPYKGWSDERHHRFIDRLLSIIEERRVYPFGAGVLNSEWENRLPVFQRVYSAMEGKRGLNKNDLKSMYLPLQIGLFKAARHCEPGKVMHFVFDSDRRTSQHITDIYLNLKRESVESNDYYRFRLGSLTFEDSKLVAPLQAADLLVYEEHRYCKQFSKAGNPELPMRIEYRRAMARAKSRDDFWLFDAVRFQKLEQHLIAKAQEGLNK